MHAEASRDLHCPQASTLASYWEVPLNVGYWQKLLERLVANKEMPAGVRLKFRDRYQDIEDRSISAAPVGFGSSHMCARTPVPLFRNFHVRGIAPTLNS